MRKIQLIVGTVMGTAQGLAEYLQKQLSDHYTIDVNLNPNIDDLTRDEKQFPTDRKDCFKSTIYTPSDMKKLIQGLNSKKLFFEYSNCAIAHDTFFHAQ